jgi:hypothetical protein
MLESSIAGGVLGIASAGGQWWLGRQQVAEQKKAALEGERRTELERAYTLGDTAARAAASGVEFDSEGIQTYLTGMSNEFARQHQWTLDQIKRGAELGNTANNIGLFTGVTKSLFQTAQANNWWQTPDAAAGAA